MAKYNEKREAVVKATTTLQGGSGYTQSPVNELLGILSVGLDNTYYEKEGDREKRFAEVLNKVAKTDKLFAAKALIYARTVFGQRTVTHRGAVEMIKHLQGDELGKKFFSKRIRKGNEGGIVYRIDDMTEILACYFAKNGEKASIPNSIKKGFKDAIEHSDSYQLAKYQMKGKTVSLVDIVNLVHPKETSINGVMQIPINEYQKAINGTKFEKLPVVVNNNNVTVPALRALVLGILKQFNTVEDKNTKTGQQVAKAVKTGEITKEEAVDVLNDAKTDNYKELIETKKIGYFALLRNVRNILKTNDSDLLNKACNLLVQKDFIIKSLVMPHQIDLALEIMLLEFDGSQLRTIVTALNAAYELSIPNLKEAFSKGETAVITDTSGSMQGGWSTGVNINGKKINASPVEKAALIAATLHKGIDSDIYHFGTKCEQLKVNPTDSINTIKSQITSSIGRAGHGTSWASIFKTLISKGKKYDRIFIISDEQSGDSVEREVKAYASKYGMPHVYCINICGYAPTMLKQTTKVHRLYGYSADIYTSAKKVELDPKIIIKAINAIKI